MIFEIGISFSGSTSEISLLFSVPNSLPNLITKDRLSQSHPHPHVPRKSTPQKSLLEEVLNAPSDKARSPPPLVNGIATSNTVHHTPTLANPPIKLVNGVENSPKMIKEKQLSPHPIGLVNGISHLDTADHVKKPKKIIKPEPEVVEDDKAMEERLIEAATFFTHYLCFNRRVGFYYTRKRPRNFALRHRILNSDDSSSSSSSKKRRKIEALTNASTSVLPQSQQRLFLPPPPRPPTPPVFVCEWSGCLQRFAFAKQVSYFTN